MGSPDLLQVFPGRFQGGSLAQGRALGARVPPAEADSKRERGCLRKRLNFVGRVGTSKGVNRELASPPGKSRAEDDLQRLGAVASTR